MKIPCFLAPLKKKDRVASPVCCRCVVCSVFSFFFILWSTLHWKSFPDTWHSLGICFHYSSAGWLLCRKELRDRGLRYHPQNPVDHLPPHTLLSSFSVSALTSWTNAIQRKETQEASFPRSRRSENTASVLDEQCGGIFTQLKPWQHLLASHATVEGQPVFCALSSECGHLCV